MNAWTVVDSWGVGVVIGVGGMFRLFTLARPLYSYISNSDMFLSEGGIRAVELIGRRKPPQKYVNF